ncbi:uncharacterized protein LOC132699168 isoform X2 [Cylas formicarius]|uniref:uncharacterized protein LOC132699168 isoform X2 n=1 Tax=Cylas formicarius TaxID=197179 RepID=UPI002958AC7A|nr:uncharacterized protein LOC132699168 isoform X2 [Cylas formicarius]
MDGTAGATSVGAEVDDDATWNCSVHPSVFFLLGTLVLTTCATGMLCAAIMTDHWEEVTWDVERLDAFANGTVRLQWLLDKKVVKVTTNDAQERTVAFFVPMHGGIWTLCLSISEEEIVLLNRVGFPPVQPCVNYLAGGPYTIRGFESRTDWQHTSFALFTLTIIHFKRLHIKPKSEEHSGTIDGVILAYSARMAERKIVELLPARIFTTSWSLDLGWGGVMLCVMTSVLWILLSKIMRFNPISSMIN